MLRICYTYSEIFPICAKIFLYITTKANTASLRKTLDVRI